jgi:hypothetical protein
MTEEVRYLVRVLDSLCVETIGLDRKIAFNLKPLTADLFSLYFPEIGSHGRFGFWECIGFVRE